MIMNHNLAFLGNQATHQGGSRLATALIVTPGGMDVKGFSGRRFRGRDQQG